MFDRFGAFLFGLSEFVRRVVAPAKAVACVGDTSTHGGSIITSGQDGSLTLGGIPVAVSGATFECPIHGVGIITSVISRTYYNSHLLVTTDAVVSCGATIIATNRNVYAG